MEQVMKSETDAARVLTTFPLFMHKMFHDFHVDSGELHLNNTQMKALMVVYIENCPHTTWLLGALYIAPWTMEMHQTAPGVIGIAITTWVTGHLVPIVYQAIEDAFRKT